MADSEEQFTTWCAGLPLVGRRAFTEQERHQLQTRFAWCSRIVWMSTAFLAAQFFILPAISQQIRVDGVMGVAATLNMFLLVLAGFGMLAHLPRHHFGRALRSKELLLFEGSVPVVSTCLAERDVLGCPGCKASLELPSVGSRPWAINGRTPAWLEVVPAFSVARVARVSDGDLVPRRLTGEEEEELQIHVKRLARRHLGEIIPPIFIWLLAIVQLAMEQLSSPPTLLIFAAAGTLAYFFSGLGVGLAARRLRPSLEHKSLAFDDSDANVLVLQGSGFAWIVQGRPAAWRTFAGSQVLPFAVEKKRKPIVVPAKHE